MECTTKLQMKQLLETPEPIENKDSPDLKQNNSYDEEARKYWKYLAQQEALRRLEQIKAHAFTSFRR